MDTEEIKEIKEMMEGMRKGWNDDELFLEIFPNYPIPEIKALGE